MAITWTFVRASPIWQDDKPTWPLDSVSGSGKRRNRQASVTHQCRALREPRVPERARTTDAIGGPESSRHRPWDEQVGGLSIDSRPLWGPTNVAFRSNSFLARLAAIRDGLGIGFLGCFMGVREKGVERLPFRFPTLPFTSGCSCTWIFGETPACRSSSIRRRRSSHCGPRSKSPSDAPGAAECILVGAQTPFPPSYHSPLDFKSFPVTPRHDRNHRNTSFPRETARDQPPFV